MKCPKCHNEINPDAKFCGFCGFDIKNYRATSKKPFESKFKCPKCHNEINPDVKFCGFCGFDIKNHRSENSTSIDQHENKQQSFEQGKTSLNKFEQDRINQDDAAKQRLYQEKLVKEKAEQQRVAQEKLNKKKAAKQRLVQKKPEKDTANQQLEHKIAKQKEFDNLKDAEKEVKSELLSETKNKTRKNSKKLFLFISGIIVLFIAAYFIFVFWPIQKEKNYWKHVKDNGSLSSFASYMEKYPDGENYETASAAYDMIISDSLYMVEVEKKKEEERLAAAEVERKKALTESNNTKYGIIKGNKVNVRKGPGIKYDIVYQLNTGDRVVVLGSEEINANGEAILKKKVHYKFNGYSVYLNQGKAVKIIARNGNMVRISAKISSNNSITLDVDKSILEISDLQTWRNISFNGRTGYVFGKFVDM